ncbi:MAG: hypothetical protein ACTHU0_27810 [Kofleriaceae bacterium]
MILYGLMVVIGAIPVAIALVRRTDFGVEATIGLILVVGGIASLGAGCRARRRRRARTRTR